MKTFFKLIWFRLLLLATMLATSACDPIPPLHLRQTKPVNTDLPIVEVGLDVLWQYDMTYMIGYASTYNWRDEWYYGWDKVDESIFNTNIGYTEPRAYNIRRYYQAYDTLAPHASVEKDFVRGNKYTAQYRYGYYDLAVWNEIMTVDGVQSIVLDETTSLDSIIAYTNSTNSKTRYQAPQHNYSYWQPDELFSAYAKNIYISENEEDYDRYDPVNNTYYKYVDLELRPIVFIYLTQVIIHNNRHRVAGTDGEANLSGMAYSTNILSHHTGNEAITVKYNNRMKEGITLPSGEVVDIIGGRLTSFGICDFSPYKVSSPDQLAGYRKLIATGRYGTRACYTRGNTGSDSQDDSNSEGSANGDSPLDDDKDPTHHYIDVTLLFQNGLDSTLVFDVTDQVMERFRGGVITVELDMDTVPIPRRPGGSGFDAVVKDFEDGGTYEFEM